LHYYEEISTDNEIVLKTSLHSLNGGSIISVLHLFFFSENLIKKTKRFIMTPCFMNNTPSTTLMYQTKYPQKNIIKRNENTSIQLELIKRLYINNITGRQEKQVNTFKFENLEKGTLFYRFMQKPGISLGNPLRWN